MHHIVDLTTEENTAVLSAQHSQSRISERQDTTNQTFSNEDIINISDNGSEVDEMGSSEEDESFIWLCNNQIGGGKYININFQQVECKRAFKDAILCKSFAPKDEEIHDLASVLHWLKLELSRELPKLLAQYHGLRAWVSMLNTYYNPANDDEQELPIQTHSQLVMNEWAIPDLIRNIQMEIVGRNSELIRGRSDLTFRKTNRLTIKVAQWDILAGRKWKKLPSFLALKRCFTNIHNQDDSCFALSLAAYLLRREAGLSRRRNFISRAINGDDEPLPEDGISTSQEDLDLVPDENDIPPSVNLVNRFSTVKFHTSRASHYRSHLERLGLTHLARPISPNSVEQLEDELKLKIHIISFFDEDGRARYPVYISKKPFKREVDLLYWNEHYALINNFSAFLADLSLSRRKLFFCRSCFGHHFSKEALNNHKAY